MCFLFEAKFLLHRSSVQHLMPIILRLSYCTPIPTSTLLLPRMDRAPQRYQQRIKKRLLFFHIVHESDYNNNLHIYKYSETLN